jgi:hypothetical protein
MASSEARGAARGRRKNGGPPLLGIVAIVAPLLLVASLVTVTAASPQSSPLTGEVLWPPQDAQTPESLNELGEGALSAEDPLTTGVQPTERVDIDRRNATTSNLTLVREGGDERSVTLGHQPADANASALRVPPTGLVPMTHVDDRGSKAVLRVWGPPGSFNVSGDTDAEKVTSLARTLDLPEDRRDGEARDRGSYHLRSLAGCAKRSGDACEAWTQVQVACEACYERVLILEPSPRSELQATTDQELGGHENKVVFVFRLSEGEQPSQLVGVRLPLAFDLNTSEVLLPDEAGQRAVDEIRKRGYGIAVREGSETVSGLEALEDAQLGLVLKPGAFVPERGEYSWHTQAFDNTPSPRYPMLEGNLSVHAVVDAETGEIRKLTFTEEGVRESESPRGSEGESVQGVSAPGVGLVGIVVASAALARARSRRG